MRRRSLLVGALSVYLAACGPAEDNGPIHRLYLDEPKPAGTAGAGGDEGGGEAGDGGAPLTPVVPMVPPSITDMNPKSGPYGTEVRIDGEGFGNAQTPGIALVLDGAATDFAPGSKPVIVSWTDTQIRFRFPFPAQGRVTVKTELGEADAGEFEPTWLPGPERKLAPGPKSLSSVSPAPGVLAVVVDRGPELITFDGMDWTGVKVAGSNWRTDSLRLFVEAGQLSAFALSSATAPEILALDPVADFAQEPSGLKVTTDYRVAGGPDGASIWYREANKWTRARPSAGVWAVDKGPIDDPNPSGARHAAGATSDGALYVGWAEDTSTLLDDKGVARHRVLAADATAFASKATTGSEMDDAISSLTMIDRGRGLITQYCGTNSDPFGLSSDEKECFAALLPAGAGTTPKEGARLRYASGDGQWALAYCNDSQGLRLVPDVGRGGNSPSALDALAGDVVAWPCPNVVAFELDSEGASLLLVEQGGVLYGPRPRVK